MRCSLTKDVTATGSTNLRPYLSLNGSVTEEPLVPEMQLVQQAEQVAREVLAIRPEIVLEDIELVELPNGPVLVVSIESPRSPLPSDIARFEAMLHERLGVERVRVVVRMAPSVDITSKGQILFGEAHLGNASADEAQQRQAVEDAVRHRLESEPNLFVTAIDAIRRAPGWAVRAEVAGPRVPAPDDIHSVEQGAAQAIGEPVELTVRARTEVVVTGTQYRAVEQLRAQEVDDP
jgi:hypothetical protein